MSHAVHSELHVPAHLTRFSQPDGVQERLQYLLAKQDGGLTLSREEQREAEGLVDLADLLTVLRLRGTHPDSEPR